MNINYRAGATQPVHESNDYPMLSLSPLSLGELVKPAAILSFQPNVCHMTAESAVNCLNQALPIPLYVGEPNTIASLASSVSHGLAPSPTAISSVMLWKSGEPRPRPPSPALPYDRIYCRKRLRSEYFVRRVALRLSALARTGCNRRRIVRLVEVAPVHFPDQPIAKLCGEFQ